MTNNAPVKVYVGLGSNLGDRRRNLDGAVRALDRLPETRVLRTSSWLENPAVGIENAPDFLNGVAEIETRLSPRELLTHLQAIEKRFGRNNVGCVLNAPFVGSDAGRRSRDPAGALRTHPTDKGRKYQNRTLDLDILLYGDRVIQEEGLVIPHPRMRERSFVLGPLRELGVEVSSTEEIL